MTQYAVDITISDEETGKEVLHVCVTREHVAAALHAATQGADTMLGALVVGVPVREVAQPGAKIDTAKAYCLTHDLMWNATGHDAQAWCATREATQQEIDDADLAVEDREFTTEPVEIEQMQQRVIGVDRVEGKPPTIVEGTYSDGVLHIGVPRGTDPNAVANVVSEIAALPGNVQPARSPGQVLIDRLVSENLHSHPGSLSEGDHRVYGAEQ